MILTSIDLFVTTKCTLRCKNCLMGVPYISKSTHTPLNEIKRDISAFFDICSTGWQSREPLFKEMSVCSGEALLHPNLVEIFEELFMHRRFFSEFRLSTNCTVLPTKRLVEFAKSSTQKGIPFVFMLNDYGNLSTKLDELLGILDAAGIEYILHKYWGDDQYCGGWLDLTAPVNKNDAEAAFEKFSNCRFSTLANGCPAIYNGLFFPCSISCKQYLTGATIEEISDGDILNLNEQNTQSEKLAAYNFITTDYRNRNRPFQVCFNCRGYDSEHGLRIPAAEQLD